MAEKRGWKVAAIPIAGGRIGTTNTVSSIDFKNNGVIRIQSEGKKYADMRFASRIGKRDFGINAVHMGFPGWVRINNGDKSFRYEINHQINNPHR
ncbi:DUF1499 domain-containing protein [uncultured Nitrosomonas sp.]|uniref:DUF1499 domain-containing protein n=1 Tax=uncultured Nitrosomonas sp. TaxID=156424 RepID=UPI0025F7876C|nr:DUF1499 domain-containing protein [uncultured Nitrosomonas sp.]